MARTDPVAARRLAKQISHPWYRCQALAEVAKYSSGRSRKNLIRAAFDAAEEQSEPNRVVTVSVWPLRVLADAEPDEASHELARLIQISDGEPHNLRRAHALQAVVFGLAERQDLLALVVPPLAAAILGGGGYRMDRVIRDTFHLVGKTNPELLEPLALHHKPNRQQEKLLALLGDMEKLAT